MRSKNGLGIFILLIAGWILTRDLSLWKDLEFGDETTYLASGVTFSLPFLGGAQWGPIYAAWYALLHLFVPDRLNLYYFNWALLSVLAGISLFVYLRSLQASFWVSLIGAVLFAFSAQNLPLNPKISIFPFLLIAFCLSVIHFQKWPNWQRMLLVAFVGLLCAYCRPEFYLSFLVGSCMSVWFWWRNYLETKTKPLLLVGLFVACCTALHLLFGNPLFSGDGSRSAAAFQQHFVINYCAWNQQPEPNTINAQLDLYHQVFGAEVESMTDALKVKPALVFRHVFTNVENTLITDLKNVVDIFYQTPLYGWYSRWRIAAFSLVLLAFLPAIDLKKTRQKFRQASFDGVGFLALFVLIFPTLVATILVYPRTHYLVFHTLLLFWIVAFVSRNIVLKSNQLARFYPNIIGVGLLVFLVVRGFNSPEKQPTPCADNVKFINGLKYKAEIVSLEREWYRVFLNHSSTWVHVEEYTQGDFGQFVREKKVNFILMTLDMQQYFAKDETFKVFLLQHEKEGFSKLTTNANREYLLVRKNLLF